VCEGTLPPGTYDNVIVRQGPRCYLSDSIVRGKVTALEHSSIAMVRDEVNGNVKALEQADVIIIDSEVRGNVKGHKADGVQVYTSIVGKSIQIVGANVPGPFGPLAAVVHGTLLPKGNIHIDKNTTLGVHIGNTTLKKGNVKVAENVVHHPLFGLVIRSNQVAGNMQVFKNSGPAEKFVQHNDIRAALRCFENTDPFIGGPNFAQKKAEGQCF
jgi:hypothetical protein